MRNQGNSPSFTFSEICSIIRKVEQTDKSEFAGGGRWGIMSDYIVKIIPTDCTYSITNKQADHILKLIKSKIKADDIRTFIYETPVFIDCGSNLKAISCPHCGAELDFNWWGESMNTASENHFKELSITMPCCDKESTLNDLLYDFPCGFACIEFYILNPVTNFDTETLSIIKDLLGNPIRVVHAHI